MDATHPINLHNSVVTAPVLGDRYSIIQEVPFPAVYGLMITKDEHPIFEEWCRDQLQFYNTVVCLDGSDSDETAKIARGFLDQIVYVHERDFIIPHKTDHGLRRVVHREILRRFGHGHWIMCCHADEFCYHDPRKIAHLAEVRGYDQVSWYSPHFYPHPTDRDDWEQTQHRAIQERIRNYHWSYFGDGFPWVEDRLFRDGPCVYWDEQTHGSVRPHGLAHPAPFVPIYKHYKVIATDINDYDDGGHAAFYRTHWQGLENRTGLPFPVNSFDDFFVSRLSKYDRCDRFEGQFLHPWNMGEEFRPNN